MKFHGNESIIVAIVGPQANCDPPNLKENQYKLYSLSKKYLFTNLHLCSAIEFWKK